MDKRREVLEKLVYADVGVAKNILLDSCIEGALTALDKLEKEKMLEIVGNSIGTEEKTYYVHNYELGYNQAKAEIRKKVRGL